MSRRTRTRTRPHGRRVFRAALVFALAGSLWAAIQAAPGWMARMSIFQVDDFQVNGLAYLTEAQVLRAAGLGPDANLWDDPAEWEERLERHPLVRRASVTRRFPSTLVIEVEEPRPVGLVPTPTLTPVDEDGRYLPLDPSRFPMDYPVLRPAGPAPQGDRPPARVRVQPLAKVAAELRQYTEFWREVSEIRLDHQGTVEVRRGSPEVLFLFPPQVEARQIRLGLAALRDGETRPEAGRVTRVDQRFGDHLYVNWDRGEDQ